MEARPYKLVAESEQGRIRSAIAQAIEVWSHDWVQDAEGRIREIAILEDCEVSPAQWVRVMGSTGESFWLGLPDQFRDVIAGAVYGTAYHKAKSSSLLSEVAQVALKDLGQQIQERLGHGSTAVWVEGEAPPGWFSRKGSGAVLAVAHLLGEQLAIVLDPSYVRQPRGDGTFAKMPLLPRHRAADRERLILRACIGGTHISVGTLETIAVGDVLILDSRIDNKIALRADGSEGDISMGFLGCRSEKKAIQISID